MTSNPHDAFFKAIFSHPEQAGSALRSILPGPLADVVDWTTLAHRSGSFVDSELAEHHADLLFSATVRGADEALLCFVFEHQSTSDAHMAFRLLRYLVRVWERWRGEHGNADKLPPVVAVVLYHGERPWSAPRSFESLIDVPNGLGPTLGPYVPSFRYLVDDLTQASDEALRARALTGPAKLALACLKHARTADDAVEVLEPWSEVLVDVARAETGSEALEHVWRYIVEVKQEPDLGPLQAFVHDRIGPEGEATMATIAERLIEQGERKGELEGGRKMLLGLIRKRFGESIGEEAERRIATATAEQLERWSGRVLTSATLADIFAD